MSRAEQQAALAVTTTDDPRWAAVVARDARADGSFCYSVQSTGIYCRPSCRSRQARPEHVRFHASAAAAEAAGFRACKRCCPDRPSRAEQYAARITEACRLIETSEEAPALAELARHVGVSTWHFHRLFKAATGLTPKAYADARRASRLRTGLAQASTVTAALHEAGYSSSGRFYAEADAVLGMTPAAYRAGGADTDIRFAVGECTLGAILVAESGRGICAILLGDEPETLVHDLQDRFPQARLIGDDDSFAERVARVIGFVEAPALGLDLPLDVRGTAFQQRVWQALRAIPAGQTASYADIAEHIGSPRAVRAVAGACAANTLAVAIPCHRVVRSDGALSGYRWGVERKRALLTREAGT